MTGVLCSWIILWSCRIHWHSENHFQSHFRHPWHGQAFRARTSRRHGRLGFPISMFLPCGLVFRKPNCKVDWKQDYDSKMTQSENLANDAEGWEMYPMYPPSTLWWQRWQHNTWVLDGFGQFSVKLASEALVEGTTVTWRSFTTALQLWGSMVKWQHLDPKIFVSPIPTMGAFFLCRMSCKNWQFLCTHGALGHQVWKILHIINESSFVLHYRSIFTIFYNNTMQNL